VRLDGPVVPPGGDHEQDPHQGHHPSDHQQRTGDAPPDADTDG